MPASSSNNPRLRPKAIFTVDRAADLVGIEDESIEPVPVFVLIGLGPHREFVEREPGTIQAERAVEHLADDLAAREVTEVAGVVVGHQFAAPGGAGDPATVGLSGGRIDDVRGTGRPMLQVGIDRRDALQRGSYTAATNGSARRVRTASSSAP